MAEVTVGIDIGTTSVKAVAAGGDGTVVARTRIPHGLHTPSATRLHHDPDEAWRRGPLAALAQVSADHDVRATVVSGMVPSMAAFGPDGSARTPGLLYGDDRAGQVSDRDPSASGEAVGFLRWCVGQAPDAAGYWPAQAAANHALTGEAFLDTVTAMTQVPLFDYEKWDPAVCEQAGTTADKLPRVVPGSKAGGRVSDTETLVGGGIVDAFAEQLVAGADHDGDVLVILGATLICWAVMPDWAEVPGLWTVPHSAPGKTLIGGPSNAGGLFQDWVLSSIADPGPTAPVDPVAVPVFTPYLRGERVPLHDPHRRGGLHDLDLTHTPAAIRRAAREASGFVVRHILDRAGSSPQRLVVTGGGVRAPGWVEAVVDATGLPADVVAVPEGAALGAAYLARVVAGLEEDASGAGRWARTARRVEPDPAWTEPVAARYQRFRELTDG